MKASIIGVDAFEKMHKVGSLLSVSREAYRGDEMTKTLYTVERRI
jgi:hypothetical protein